MKKNIILLTAILIATGFSTFAANYEETMKQNIEKLNQLRSANELTELANQFDRIGQKETKEWLPEYYAAYSYMSILFFNTDLTPEQKKGYIEKAQGHIDKTLAINDKESEIYVLLGMLYSLSITDASNAYQLSTQSNEALAKAEKLNPNNPRIYYLKGLNVYHTPAEFGGGASVAKPLFVKAESLFKQQKSKNPLMPQWGEYNNNMVLSQCGENK